jgi:hypothetical protein
MTVTRQELEKSLRHDWDQRIRTKFSALRLQDAKSDTRVSGHLRPNLG